MAVAPPIRTTGDCAICAFFTAVIVFVSPGPAVTTATPGLSDNRVTASAAKTAVTSWRTSITLMLFSLAATKMGEMWPPHSVKRCSVPWRMRALATLWPP